MDKIMITISALDLLAIVSISSGLILAIYVLIKDLKGGFIK